MRSTVRLVTLGIGIALIALFAADVSWAEGYSHARIVRLSFAEGEVTVQRPDVAEWSTAPVNTPIQEGFQLSTAESGFAEVEFENSSTARLGQLSLLEFTQLALMPSGGKVNRLTLRQGYATFNVIPEGEDFYEVKAGSATLTPSGKTRFRVDYDEGVLQVKVFKGSVEVLSPEGNGTLGKDTVLEVRPGTDEPFLISQGITKDAWDEWVEERENRVRVARSQGPAVPYSTAASDLLYGWMDLLSFGNWYSLPGYGWGWLPMADYGWAPFTYGRWCWYPGFGYVWISSEPWGWLPYHYGSWIYQPGLGWCWIPGDFGFWSPAVVNWYRGPGWIGWAPMSPRLGGTQNNCPQPQGCVTRVNDDAFRGGRPVRPNRLREVDVREGRPVERPDIAPDRAGMLPGSPRIGTAAVSGTRGAERVGRIPLGSGPERGVPGAATGATPASGIVYDREQRRYVNGAGPGAAPAVNTPAGRLGRPGPAQNYPASMALEPANVGGGAEQRSVSPRSTRPSSWESRPTGAYREAAPGAASRTPNGPGGRSSASPSSSRTAPSQRSDSGPRSSSVNSGYSASSRSSGSDHGSGSHSSGGWGSGSSGAGSHSSGGGGFGSGGGGSRGSGGGGSAGSSGGSHSSGGPRH
jgi:hypothetical protein